MAQAALVPQVLGVQQALAGVRVRAAFVFVRLARLVIWVMQVALVVPAWAAGMVAVEPVQERQDSAVAVVDMVAAVAVGKEAVVVSVVDVR